MSIQGKLQRRGDGNLTAEQMAWLAVFEAQRTDCSDRTGDVRRRHELIIAELELRLREAKAAMDQEMTNVNREFLPFGDYAPIPLFEFNKQCWAEYLNQCLISGVPHAALTPAAAQDAVKTFGDIVRQRHILDFLTLGDRKTQLQDFLNTKIGQFDNAKEERAAKRLRLLLASVDLEVPPQTPGGVPPAAGGQNTGGPNPLADAD